MIILSRSEGSLIVHTVYIGLLSGQQIWSINTCTLALDRFASHEPEVTLRHNSGNSVTLLCCFVPLTGLSVVLCSCEIFRTKLNLVIPALPKNVHFGHYDQLRIGSFLGFANSFVFKKNKKVEGKALPSQVMETQKGFHLYFDNRHNQDGTVVSCTLRPHFTPKEIPW